MNQPQVQVSDVKAGCFVTTKFVLDKSEKTFVGLVLNKDKDECEIKFMRAKDAKKTVFIFREPEDKSWVDNEQIVSILLTPSMGNRDRYIFPESVNGAE